VDSIYLFVSVHIFKGFFLIQSQKSLLQELYIHQFTVVFLQRGLFIHYYPHFILILKIKIVIFFFFSPLSGC